MHVIGLAGGIASGKSTVAAELAALGAVVLDADRAAHQAINRPEVKQTLVERWGEAILDGSGEVLRQAIAERVFSPSLADNQELEFLESLLHPLVRRQFESELAPLTQRGVAAAVIDAPLLLDAGWEDLCDFIVFVESNEQDRVQRAGPRNWSHGEISRREAAQMPIDEKRRRATHVIRNLGSRGDLKGEVQAFWNSIFPEKDPS
jgi:dephospho-CoA kinase